MRFNHQTKVALATVLCLLGQGYILAYFLEVEVNPIISFIPLLPYVVYVYARGKRTWYYNRPEYWIAAIAALTAIDLAPFVFMAMGK
jgi:hypothetical protein